MPLVERWLSKTKTFTLTEIQCAGKNHDNSAEMSEIYVDLGISVFGTMENKQRGTLEADIVSNTPTALHILGGVMMYFHLIMMYFHLIFPFYEVLYCNPLLGFIISFMTQVFKNKHFDYEIGRKIT